jgi:hypothetical protein
MIDVVAVHEFYRYNAWSNDRILRAASNLTQEKVYQRDGKRPFVDPRYSYAHRLGRMVVASAMDGKLAADYLPIHRLSAPGRVEGAMVRG